MYMFILSHTFLYNKGTIISVFHRARDKAFSLALWCFFIYR